MTDCTAHVAGIILLDCIVSIAENGSAVLFHEIPGYNSNGSKESVVGNMAEEGQLTYVLSAAPTRHHIYRLISATHGCQSTQSHTAATLQSSCPSLPSLSIREDQDGDRLTYSHGPFLLKDSHHTSRLVTVTDWSWFVRARFEFSHVESCQRKLQGLHSSCLLAFFTSYESMTPCAPTFTGIEDRRLVLIEL
jgi:hypothetical protein